MPWNSDLNRALNYIYDAGLVKHLIGRYIPAKYLDQSEDFSVPPTAFKPAHILGALVVLVTGLFLALLVLLLEHILS